MAELEKATEQWIEEVSKEEEGAVGKGAGGDKTSDADEHEQSSTSDESAESMRKSKKRRLSWSGSFSLVPPHSSASSSGHHSDPSDPTPPPTPTLRSLSLWTVETTSLLREDDNVRDAIEEIVERGVAVTWWEMRIVLLDTLELTRELRKDMLLGEQATTSDDD
ncbi:hypothetical protein BCR35DRAFT_302000 [Leucosporidium creatinivorum]|uniref:Uncharacterized protein n=1 Tax=Leucosporidium creatinivorum TaxID=106004 RepID=A0A1Y2FY24_9BASI|nr:hypothetical protein BCR35DRAFT_302000 [Leucosporidium creatinivorum]